ncbi:MAG: Ig-like domain-containing protein [Armatimonadota bacterium]|nr:Ig-like domain-containing protein [bacterium]
MKQWSITKWMLAIGIVVLSQQPTYAEWKYVASLGQKDYMVTMNLSSQKNGIIEVGEGEDACYMPPGCSAGEGSITLPGNVSFGVSTCCPEIYEYGGFPYYPLKITPGAVSWCLTAMLSGGRTEQLVTSGSSATFTVSVSGQAERWANLSTGGSQRNGARDVMGNTTVEVKDVLISPTITVTLGDQSFSYVGPSTVDDNNIIEFNAWATSPVIGEPIQSGGSYQFPSCSVAGTWDGAYNTSGTTWVTGTYSRKSAASPDNNVAEEVRSFGYSNSNYQGGCVYAPLNTVITVNGSATVGNGSFSLSGGYGNGSPDSIGHDQSLCDYYGYIDLCGLHFKDYCGAYDVCYENDIKNIDGSARNDIKVLGSERHPIDTPSPVTGLAPTESVSHSNHTYTWPNEYIDLSSGPIIHYGGRWNVNFMTNQNSMVPGGAQDYIDLPSNVTQESISHGTLTAVDIPGEPSHADQQPGWYDNQVLVRGNWRTEDALQINLSAPGDIPVPPLDFFELSGWTDPDSKVSKQDNSLVITTPLNAGYTTEIEDLIDENIRLTGTRFAKVHWASNRAGAEAVLHLGGHSWNLKAATTGAQTTMIDLCHPDKSTVFAQDHYGREDSYAEIKTIENIIESPHPTLGVSGGNAWVGYYSLPAGAKSVKFHIDQIDVPYYVEIVNADTGDSLATYWTCTNTDTDTFYAKNIKFIVWLWESEQAYGIKIDKQYVTYPRPMQSIIPIEWPLSDQQYGSTYWEYPAGWGVGRVVSTKLECKTPDTEYRFDNIQLYRKTSAEGGFAKLYVLPHQPAWNDTLLNDDWSWIGSDGDPIIRKAHLVVDGAVVLEIPAGTSNHPWKLLPEEGATGMHVLAYPVDDYTNPTHYATNGVANVITNLSSASPFIQANCYTTYLVGGNYSERADHTIKVPFEITPDTIDIHIGTIGTVVTGMTKRFRGGVQGLLFDEDGKPAAGRLVNVYTPGAPNNQKTDTTVATNRLGWFETPAINTKAPAVIETSTSRSEITTRNRFISRLVSIPYALGSSSSTFEITDVDPLSVEPVYGDTVNIKWRRTDGVSNVQAILILRRNDTSGQVEGSDGAKYDLVTSLSPGSDTQNPAWNSSTNPYKWIGSVSWQPPADPACRYEVGVQYQGQTIVQTKWSNNGQDVWPHFFVAVSVYDVYTEDTCYPGSYNQGTSIIHYTLSSAVNICSVNVADRTIPGGTAAGENTVTWDGKDASGNYIHDGQFPITITTDPACGIVLNSTIVSSPTSITPGGGAQCNIIYRLSEPGVRPNTTVAYLNAAVYDDISGQLVKILKNGDQVDVDYDLGGSVTGENTLSWDGKDESGDIVPPGDYKITLAAQDNLGEGRESTLQTVSVQVLAADPGGVLDVGQGSSSSQNTISGYTNSNATVSWTDSVGGSGTVTPDANGEFSFTTDSTPGLHTITTTTTRAGYPQTTTVSNIFINELALNSVTTSSGNPPYGETGRFRPASSETVSAAFTSLAADKFNVTVSDIYDSPECISPDNPMPAFELLNGKLSLPKTVCTIWDKHDFIAGQSTVAWNGTDGQGSTLPAGPYLLEIIRSNDDGLCCLSQQAVVTIDSSGTTPPTISGISTSVSGTQVVIAWKTSVPTTGSVLYGTEDTPVGRVRARESSTFHVVYLPVIESNTEYYYWIVAEDSDGDTIASDKRSVISGDGESFYNLEVAPVSDTEVAVKWTSPTAKYGRVYYAEVIPYATSLTWRTADDIVAVTDHSISLTGLSANSEYVFRAMTSDNALYTNGATSSYSGFDTKSSNPSVVITSPCEMGTVSGTVNVTVEASDPIHRFSSNGIMAVCLYIDGRLCSKPSHIDGSNEYIFQFDTSTLRPGIHSLQAYATDEFWNESSYRRDVYIAATGILAMSSESGENTKKKNLVSAIVACFMEPRPSLMDAPPAKKRSGLAIIIAGNWGKYGGDTNHPRQSISDKRYQAIIWAIAAKEDMNYTSFGYSTCIIRGWTCKDTAHFIQLVLNAWDRGKAFTYVGHGYPGEIDPQPDIPAIWADATELHDEHIKRFEGSSNSKKPKNTLDVIRLFCCNSGDPDGNGRHLHVEAFEPCPKPRRFKVYNHKVLLDVEALPYVYSGIGF